MVLFEVRFFLKIKFVVGNTANFASVPCISPGLIGILVKHGRPYIRGGLYTEHYSTNNKRTNTTKAAQEIENEHKSFHQN